MGLSTKVLHAIDEEMGRSGREEERDDHSQQYDTSVYGRCRFCYCCARGDWGRRTELVEEGDSS